MNSQVIIFGHSLSDTSMQFLTNLLGTTAKVYRVDFHIDRFNLALQEVDKIFDLLRSKGADLSGRSRTIMVPPGSSVGSMILVAGWVGLTGDFPEVLNLIRRGDNVYAPSPETPVLHLTKYCDDKLLQDIELVSLQSLKSSIRQRKRSPKGPSSCEVQSLANYTPRPPKRQFHEPQAPIQALPVVTQ